MILRVIDVQLAGGYRIWLRFRDDLTREIDLQCDLRSPVFEALTGLREFAKVRAHSKLGTMGRTSSGHVPAQRGKGLDRDPVYSTLKRICSFDLKFRLPPVAFCQTSHNGFSQ